MKSHDSFGVYNGKIGAICQVYGPRFVGLADIDYVQCIHDGALAKFDEQWNSPFSARDEFFQHPHIIRDPGCPGVIRREPWAVQNS